MLREILEGFSSDEKKLNKLRDDLNGQTQTDAKTNAYGPRIVLFVTGRNNLVLGRIAGFSNDWHLSVYEGSKMSARLVQQFNLGNDIDAITADSLRALFKKEGNLMRFRGKGK